MIYFKWFIECILTLIMITLIVKVSKEKDDEFGYWMAMFILVAIMAGVAFGVKT